MHIEISHKGLLLDCTIKQWPKKYEAGFEVEAVALLENEDKLIAEEIAEVLADHEGIEAAVAEALAVMIEGRDY